MRQASPFNELAIVVKFKNFMFSFLFFRVFDEQRMSWLTSQNGRTGEFQEIRIKRCVVFEATWMSKPSFAQEKHGAV